MQQEKKDILSSSIPLQFTINHLNLTISNFTNLGLPSVLEKPAFFLVSQETEKDSLDRLVSLFCLVFVCFQIYSTPSIFLLNIGMRSFGYGYCHINLPQASYSSPLVFCPFILRSGPYQPTKFHAQRLQRTRRDKYLETRSFWTE